MPRRHAASGDASPASQDTINVAMPRQHRPPTRLKLKVRPRDPEPESDPAVLLSRPKRKISRPARYSDNVIEPLIKKRRTTKIPNMYLEKSTSPPPNSGPPVSNSSDPILLTSSKPVDKSDYDSNEVHPAGYGADFLNNFIDDTPRSSLSALDSVIDSDRSHKLQPDLLPESDALPDAAGLMYDTFTDLTSEPPTFAVKEVQDTVVLSSFFSPQLDQLDNAEVCVKKLQNACHALGGLSMPPVPPRNHLSATPVVKDRDDSVEALLAAASGCDEAEAEASHSENSHDAGEPDEEMILLINKAIEILNYHIVSIRKLETQTARQEGRHAKGKRYTKGQYRTDTEQFVLSALEPLLQGGATNIGCIISSERANLLWHLYSQLIHFVTAPHFALPRTFRILQEAANGIGTQHHVKSSAVARASSKKPSQVLPRKKGKAAKVPVPHQFLSHQKSSS
ncbi:hypothetical protein D6D12_07422 [Aureobasidium pullulans]|uniref:Uncharacterized protein n=1 Tax=Aureobasidium pullulans TaxID=5580 RepID=A0A4S9EZB8_AURPU|nr:hypothetical protein D6D12_07422 [Aureobasidium pullulans]THX40096.1 hypothetical protein D6D11_08733 [Aureobasidium pullulans]THX86168.1 hypothetical protein D6D04_01532 [Aureobasidium pullulans]